jgi:adenylate cyclase class 2
MLEVELKARLHKPAEVEKRVAGFATRLRGFEKFDSYWHGPDWRFVRGTKGFRVRTDDGKHVVNFKNKRTDAGIEINQETEFEVSDRSAFLALVQRIGCEPFFEKHKSGSAWRYQSSLIELVKVDGLGHFIEIEFMLEQEDPAAIALAQGELKRILSLAGVAESDIEARGYSELLLAEKDKIQGYGSPP